MKLKKDKNTNMIIDEINERMQNMIGPPFITSHDLPAIKPNIKYQAEKYLREILPAGYSFDVDIVLTINDKKI